MSEIAAEYLYLLVGWDSAARSTVALVIAAAAFIALMTWVHPGWNAACMPLRWRWAQAGASTWTRACGRSITGGICIGEYIDVLAPELL